MPYLSLIRWLPFSNLSQPRLVAVQTDHRPRLKLNQTIKDRNGQIVGFVQKYNCLFFDLIPECDEIWIDQGLSFIKENQVIAETELKIKLDEWAEERIRIRKSES